MNVLAYSNILLVKLRAHSKTRFINVHIFIYKKIKFASLANLKDPCMYQPSLKLVFPLNIVIFVKSHGKLQTGSPSNSDCANRRGRL